MKIKLAFFIFLNASFLSDFAFSQAKIAPNFVLLNNKGEYVYKSKIKGNLIISFWASYCKPCRKEMPLLIDLTRQQAKGKNLQLLLINTDSNPEGQKKADKMLQELNISEVYLLDAYQVVLRKYNPLLSVPATYLIDSKGRIIFTAVGDNPGTMEKLAGEVKKLN
jgi:thiol-disulfide isomerase/thioredoxin